MAMMVRNDSGQATVELAVALPILIAVALVMSNALLYLSECARFDRLARNAIRICAASPAYGEDAGACASAAESLLQSQMSEENVACSVSVSADTGLVRFVAGMDYRPAFLGTHMREEVFGVPITPLRHEISLVVDPFDAGVIA